MSRGSPRRVEAQKRGMQCRRRTERSTAPFKTTGNTVRVEDKLQGQVRDMTTEWAKLEVGKPAFLALDTTLLGLLGQVLSTVWAHSLI